MLNFKQKKLVNYAVRVAMALLFIGFDAELSCHASVTAYLYDVIILD